MATETRADGWVEMSPVFFPERSLKMCRNMDRTALCSVADHYCMNTLGFVFILILSQLSSVFSLFCFHFVSSCSQQMTINILAHMINVDTGNFSRFLCAV